jgi:hypothetical protein
MNLSFRVRTVTKPLSWNMYLRPSCTSWCARHTRSRLLMWLNYGEKKKKNQLSDQYDICLQWMGHVPMRGQVHYLRSDPRPKKPTCSSGANCPCLYIFRITPHEITEWPFMWNLTIPFNYSYLPCDREKKCISTNHEEKKQQEIIVQHTAPQWRLPLSLHCVLPKCTVLQLNYYKEKKNTWSIVRMSGERPPWTQST